MSTTEFTLTLITTIVTCGSLVFSIWRYRPRHGLRWGYLPPKSMLDIAEQVAKSLKISYNEQQINNLTRYLFILHNTGLDPLDRDAIVETLKWQAPDKSKILSADIVKSDPPVKLEIKHSEQYLKVSWELFNQRCKALIEVLCTGDANTGVGQVKGQITNVPIIKQKEISWIDEEEVIQKMKTNLELQNVFSRFVGRVFARRWFLKTLRLIQGIYLVGICVGTPVLVMLAFEVAWPLILAIGLLIVVLIFSLFFMYRNPYTKFLKSIKDPSDSA